MRIQRVHAVGRSVRIDAEVAAAEAACPDGVKGVSRLQVSVEGARSQADTPLACDFLETVTLTGTRMYVLAVIAHASRRIRILGATAPPTAGWVAQAAGNLVVDLEDTGCRARFLIRDRDGKFPEFTRRGHPGDASRSSRAGEANAPARGTASDVRLAGELGWAA